MSFDPEEIECVFFVSSERRIEDLQDCIAIECHRITAREPSVRIGTIDTDDYLIDVGINLYRKDGVFRRDDRGFLFAPFKVDLFAKREIGLKERVAFVTSVGRSISRLPAVVVVSCEYEDMLPDDITVRH